MAWTVKTAATSPAVVASPSLAEIMSAQAVESVDRDAARLVQRQLDAEAEKERREEAEAIALVAALVTKEHGRGSEAVEEVSAESLAASAAETAAAAAASKQAALDADMAMAFRLQAEEQALSSRKPNLVIGGSAPSRFGKRGGSGGVHGGNDDDDEEEEGGDGGVLNSSKAYKAKNFGTYNKHDHALNKALNAKRLEEWDGELDVGCLDGLGGIGGKVFSKLKSHAKSGFRLLEQSEGKLFFPETGNSPFARARHCPLHHNPPPPKTRLQQAAWSRASMSPTAALQRTTRRGRQVLVKARYNPNRRRNETHETLVARTRPSLYSNSSPRALDRG